MNYSQAYPSNNIKSTKRQRQYPQTAPNETNKLTPSTNLLQNNAGPAEYSYSGSSNPDDLHNQKPQSLEAFEQDNQQRSVKIDDLLNKMTSSSGTEDDNDNMGDFNPFPPNAPTHSKKDYPTISLEQNNTPATMPTGSGNLTPPYSDAPKYSNYRHIYNQSVQLPQHNKPYYANMGIGKGGEGGQDIYMEKMNYIIHLLEQQQNEQTSHIGEEFVLYAFLGIFVIYVVDSFSRMGGKYTR